MVKSVLRLAIPDTANLNRQSGFTLIELIMVVVVFSISAVALMSSFANVGTAVGVSDNLQIAKASVQECSEFIVMSRRDTVNGFVNVSATSCNFLPLLSGYTRAVTVTTSTAAPCPTGASCKLVRVSVSRGGSELAVLNTLLTNY